MNRLWTKVTLVLAGYAAIGAVRSADDAQDAPATLNEFTGVAAACQYKCRARAWRVNAFVKAFHCDQRIQSLARKIRK